MLTVAHATTDFQRLARVPQRARWARCALAVVRAVLVLAPLVCGLLAIWHGEPHLAAVELAGATLAAGLAWSASPVELCRLAWLLLSPHVARRRHAAAAAAAAARAGALAHARNCMFCIAMQQWELIRAAAMVTIGKRLLAHVCITTRITAQRPN